MSHFSDLNIPNGLNADRLLDTHYVSFDKQGRAQWNKKWSGVLGFLHYLNKAVRWVLCRQYTPEMKILAARVLELGKQTDVLQNDRQRATLLKLMNKLDVKLDKHHKRNKTPKKVDFTALRALFASISEIKNQGATPRFTHASADGKQGPKVYVDPKTGKMGGDKRKMGSIPKKGFKRAAADAADAARKAQEAARKAKEAADKKAAAEKKEAIRQAAFAKVNPLCERAQKADLNDKATRDALFAEANDLRKTLEIADDAVITEETSEETNKLIQLRDLQKAIDGLDLEVTHRHYHMSAKIRFDSLSSAYQIGLENYTEHNKAWLHPGRSYNPGVEIHRVPGKPTNHLEILEQGKTRLKETDCRSWITGLMQSREGDMHGPRGNHYAHFEVKDNKVHLYTRDGSKLTPIISEEAEGLTSESALKAIGNFLGAVAKTLRSADDAEITFSVARNGQLSAEVGDQEIFLGSLPHQNWSGDVEAFMKDKLATIKDKLGA